jgi:hypothetical protein
MVDTYIAPDHVCPSNDCRGQFFHVRDVGIVCSLKLNQLAGWPPSLSKMYNAGKVPRELRIEKETQTLLDGLNPS